LEGLEGLIPVERDIFLPEFSTSDGEAKLAHKSCFLQTVSPYFSYKCGCGIPRVKVLGTQQDYWKIVSCLERISENWAKVEEGA